MKHVLSFVHQLWGPGVGGWGVGRYFFLFLLVSVFIGTPLPSPGDCARARPSLFVQRLFFFLLYKNTDIIENVGSTEERNAHS